MGPVDVAVVVPEGVAVVAPEGVAVVELVGVVKEPNKKQMRC